MDIAASILAHDYGTCKTCQTMVEEVERLRSALDTAERDPIWGIYSRQGVERRMRQLTAEYATVVIDLDDMHGKNAAFGHHGVDTRVTKVMRQADVLSGRWLRGDEIVLFPHKAEALGLAHRVLGGFFVLDLSATIAVVWGNTQDAIALGLLRIEEAKEANQRGRVYVVEGGTA